MSSFELNFSIVDTLLCTYQRWSCAREKRQAARCDSPTAPQVLKPSHFVDVFKFINDIEQNIKSKNLYYNAIYSIYYSENKAQQQQEPTPAPYLPKAMAIEWSPQIMIFGLIILERFTAYYAAQSVGQLSSDEEMERFEKMIEDNWQAHHDHLQSFLDLFAVCAVLALKMQEDQALGMTTNREFLNLLFASAPQFTVGPRNPDARSKFRQLGGAAGGAVVDATINNNNNNNDSDHDDYHDYEDCGTETVHLSMNSGCNALENNVYKGIIQLEHFNLIERVICKALGYSLVVSKQSYIKYCMDNLQQHKNRRNNSGSDYCFNYFHCFQYHSNTNKLHASRTKWSQQFILQQQQRAAGNSRKQPRHTNNSFW